MTHWEKRVFGDEAMTGNHQQLELEGKIWREQQPISRISLAVLQDSGWYTGKFSGTEGGCRRESASPFCNLVKHKSPLPAEYQHLEKGPDGGSGERWGAGMWLADF